MDLENGQHIPEEMNWSPSSSVDTACTIFPSFPSIEPEWLKVLAKLFNQNL